MRGYHFLPGGKWDASLIQKGVGEGSRGSERKCWLLKLSLSLTNPPDSSSGALQLPVVLGGHLLHSIFCTIYLALFDASEIHLFLSSLINQLKCLLMTPASVIFSVVGSSVFCLLNSSASSLMAFWEGERADMCSARLSELPPIITNIIAFSLIFFFFLFPPLFIGWGHLLLV